LWDIHSGKLSRCKSAINLNWTGLIMFTFIKLCDTYLTIWIPGRYQVSNVQLFS
jgi:hypothetical protein